MVWAKKVMDETTIEDLAFSNRPQGELALPAGRECLSTVGIRKICTSS